MLQVTYPSPGEHPSAPRERGIFPITDDELCDLASTAQLPVPIKADVASLVVVAQTIAVTVRHDTTTHCKFLTGL